MNRIFKIIGRNNFTKRQHKKRIYTSVKDYMKYKDDLIKRYEYCHGIAECYELENNKWIRIYE